jgi:cyclic beta-1,2-glucan synthetase
LPLIGNGDWNDGMDRVGNKGQGESIWLAFFLYDVLMEFSKVATDFGDEPFAEVCSTQAAMIQANIETAGWDGQWYLRAYFDNGNVLGSMENDECQIDAIAQSWSVLSGAANNKRAHMAMRSLDEKLVNKELKLIQLLDPPFDHSELNPGYIKGYVPGVRENGGQYSHAAIWALMAFAKLGDKEKVYELFSLINPINHAKNPEDVEVYKVEPYVMAADVYANESHKGRGGWTWYTGSSGWMYQFIIGNLLGMKLEKDELSFYPCFPLSWPSVNVKYRYGNSSYNITVYQLGQGKDSFSILDNTRSDSGKLMMTDDGKEHIAEIHIASRSVSEIFSPVVE